MIFSRIFYSLITEKEIFLPKILPFLKSEVAKVNPKSYETNEDIGMKI